MSLEDAVEAEKSKPFSLRRSDFAPFGIGLWKYCWRATEEAKRLGEKAEEYEPIESLYATLLCAYSIATVAGAAWGIHKLYDFLK